MISTLYNDHREEEERKQETGVTGLGKIPEQILISVVTALITCTYFLVKERDMGNSYFDQGTH